MQLQSCRRFAIAAVLAGCATTANYVYVPGGASYWREGYPVVATELAHGTVEVTSFGMTELVPEGPTLHVRMSIANTGDATAWTVKTADQVLELAGARTQLVLVKSDIATTPTLAIATGEHRVIDLYFRMPSNVRDEGDLTAFDFAWQVTTPARAVSGRSHFQRVDQEPIQPYSHVTFHSGVPYWFR